MKFDSGPGPKPGVAKIDEFDARLLEVLKTEPRAPTTVLAEALGVSEATVAARLRGMHADGVMRVIAQRDFRAEGYEVLAFADIDTAGREVSQVARDLAAIQAVASVVYAMGNPSIIALICAADLAGLRDLVEGAVAAIAGVASVETTILVDVLKWEAGLGRIDD